MNIIIQSIHFKVDSKLKDYIEKKLTKLETFYSGIIDARVFLKVENASEKENKIVEIVVNAKQNNFIQTETAQSFEAATDIAVDHLKTQVKRYKGKVEAV